MCEVSVMVDGWQGTTSVGQRLGHWVCCAVFVWLEGRFDDLA